MFKLRKLRDTDTIYMFEWIKDPHANLFLRFDPDKISIDMVREFIDNANDMPNSEHLAIADQDDMYLGMVSLRNIDRENRNAEFEIALRRCAVGRGVDNFGIKAMLGKAFSDYGLNKVYINIVSRNLLAKDLYERCGFKCEGRLKKHLLVNGKYRDLLCYSILKEEYEKLCEDLEYTTVFSVY
ncbi:MAG: GNAT family protein [Oscillospiraceae bacterium]|nr:GNAT family protein [Oscillospiraceae bacterium]MDD3833647.1 GNAT family protein [Oscillospiraceae bacterium]MDD4546221.1 GNAT family protein [Oscillospiraceae bacterium]